MVPMEEDCCEIFRSDPEKAARVRERLAEAAGTVEIFKALADETFEDRLRLAAGGVVHL